MKLCNRWVVIALLITAMGFSSLANAALVGRDLDGNLTTAEAYYDNVADLTWLADANANGTMNWADANSWAAGLSVSGVGGWRLPTSDTCIGFNCTGSEMGDLFYNALKLFLTG